MEGLDIVVKKAMINGLIATAVIWIFWTPFIIVVAVPIINDIIKDFLCKNAYEIRKMVTTSFGNDTETDLNKILPNPPITSDNVLNENPAVFWDKNAGLTIIFCIIGGVIIFTSLYAANRLIYLFGFDHMEFIKFNVLMALIIFGCEVGFFLGVTTSYIPFEFNQLLDQLNERISDYLTPLANTGNNIYYRSAKS
jgi:hypothetical protein